MHEFYIRPGSRLSTKNTADWNARYYEKGLAILFTKSQLISKAIYGLLNSPKKQTDEFVLFAFLLFTANKSNSSVHFLGESTALQSAFWFYLTFRTGLAALQNTNLYMLLLQVSSNDFEPTYTYHIISYL